MSAEQLEQVLWELLVGREAEELGVARVLTFEEAGVMTYNRGLVLSTEEGDEFQLTLVCSGRAEP